MHPIHYFSDEGDLETVKAQVKSGGPAVLHLKDETVGRTALHFALNKGHVELVKFLLDGGSDVYAQDSTLYNALHAAVAAAIRYASTSDQNKLNSIYQIFELLLTHEAKLRSERPKDYINLPLLKNAQDDMSMTAIESARRNPAVQAKLREVIQAVESRQQEAVQETALSPAAALATTADILVEEEPSGAQDNAFDTPAITTGLRQRKVYTSKLFKTSDLRSNSTAEEVPLLRPSTRNAR